LENIKDKYKNRKQIYRCLIGALLSIIIIFGIISPKGEHPATTFEIIMFIALLVIVVAMYIVLRCPKCNASLVGAHSSFWVKFKYCPKCGEELTE
jgi:hypothetical protein